jgi:hypothetical protein
MRWKIYKKFWRGPKLDFASKHNVKPILWRVLNFQPIAKPCCENYCSLCICDMCYLSCEVFLKHFFCKMLMCNEVQNRNTKVLEGSTKQEECKITMQKGMWNCSAKKNMCFKTSMNFLWVKKLGIKLGSVEICTSSYWSFFVVHFGGFDFFPLHLGYDGIHIFPLLYISAWWLWSFCFTFIWCWRY